MLTRKRVLRKIGLLCFIFQISSPSFASHTFDLSLSEQFRLHMSFYTSFYQALYKNNNALTVYVGNEKERRKRMQQFDEFHKFIEESFYRQFLLDEFLKTCENTSHKPEDLSQKHREKCSSNNTSSKALIEKPQGQLACPFDYAELPDIVLSYFSESGIKGRRKGSSLPIKKILRRGARLYGKVGDLVSTFKVSKDVVTASSEALSTAGSGVLPSVMIAAAGVLEKTMDYLQSSSDAESAQKALTAVQEFERLCSEDSSSDVSDACEVILRRVSEMKSEVKEEEGKVSFVGIKTVNDFMRLGA